MANNDIIMTKEELENEIVENEQTDNEETENYKDIIAKIENKNKQIKQFCREIDHLTLSLKKTVKLDIKDASKKRRNNNNGVKKTASGFQAAQKIPKAFTVAPWNFDPEEKKPRTELTRTVYKWIKENNLQDPNDKRRIFPDDHINKLFGLKPDDELHFSNFQTYMKKLYDNIDNEEVSDFSEPEKSVDDTKSTSSVKKKKKKKTTNATV